MLDKMKFAVPEEPVNLRQKWNEELKKGGGKMNIVRWTIKQGTWITSPLWSEYKWKEDLKKNGITWQKFMELYRNRYYRFIEWVEGSCSWSDAVRSLIQEIEQEIRRSPSGSGDWVAPVSIGNPFPNRS